MFRLNKRSVPFLEGTKLILGCKSTYLACNFERRKCTRCQNFTLPGVSILLEAQNRPGVSTALCIIIGETDPVSFQLNSLCGLIPPERCLNWDCQKETPCRNLATCYTHIGSLANELGSLRKKVDLIPCLFLSGA